MCAAPAVDSPFVVINADDFYGAESYALLGDFLRGAPAGERPPRYAMAGYVLKNTLSKNGLVARGVCQVDKNGDLGRIDERKKIGYYDGGVCYLEDGALHPVSPEAPVSLNIWAFSPEIFAQLDSLKADFFATMQNPLKDEFLLPTAVGQLISQGRARVKVLPSRATWHGVTYQEDREPVKAALAALHQAGAYPPLK